MRAFDKLRLRLRSLFKRGDADTELDAEMQFHLDQLTEENIAKGMTPREARDHALRAIGGITQFTEECRDMRGLSLLDDLMRDARYGLRGLRRNPGFTTVAILTLALGLGVNTAVFTLLYNVTLRPLPYPDADRLVRINLTVQNNARGPRDVSFSYPKFLDVQCANTVFDAMAAYALRRYTISSPGAAESVRGEVVSAAYFPMFGINVAVGRTFLPEEDLNPGAHSLVILSDELWRRRFSADPLVVGRTMKVDSKTYQVIGVAPPGVRGDSGQAQFWLPISAVDPKQLTARRAHWHEAVAHLKTGVTLDHALSELRAIMQRVAEQDPASSGRWDINATLLPESKIDRRLSKGLALLYAAVGLVLLIACANLANLSLARMLGRQREVAVRIALGAGRKALVRQILVENVLLSIGGGVVGIALAAWSLKLLDLFRPESQTGYWPSYLRQLDAQALQISTPVLVVSAFLAFAASLVFGMIPALRATRIGVNDVLKGAGADHQARLPGTAFRNALLAGQIALAVVLVASASLMLQSLARLTGVPVGAETRSILTVPLAVPYRTYDAARARQFFDRVMTGARVLPGVEAVTLGQGLPGLVRNTVTDLQAIDAVPERGYIGLNKVDPGFFELFRIPLQAGRTFADKDRQGPPVAVLGESAARAIFPNRNPIGHNLTVNGTAHEIVGIVADIRYGAQSQQLPIAGDMFIPPPNVWNAYLIVRSTADPESLLPALRRIVAEVDPEIPVQDAATMSDRILRIHSYERFSTALIAVFALLALTLALVGVYGVFSYCVAARTQEFGIRISLGATGADLFMLVVREAAVLCGVGLMVGIPSAHAVSKVLESIVSGASVVDPWIYVMTCGTLTCAVCAASIIPAVRAARIEPLLALRRG